MKAANVHYTLTPSDPKGHLYQVTLTIEHPAVPVQTVSLPNWIPGSYLIRDFSKHLIALKAHSHKGKELCLEALDNASWQFANDGEPVTLSYQVYAWDLSVRGAHFDETHGFFNGTSVFLTVDGQRDQPVTLCVQSTEFCRLQQWRVATGMPPLEADDCGFGWYACDSYTALIDYPFEMGTFREITFEACGVPHRMVLTGVFECDFDRLRQDLTRICEAEMALFGQPAPMESYLFQVTVTGSDYGGLEHRNSTALLCSRDDLPYPGMQAPSDGYLQFLELCSHEYFHLWNVKRIQPEVFQVSDLKEPAYTNQLWWFEGVTSYYDLLILLRAGIIEAPKYLDLLAQQMTRVYRMPGRFTQSVAESSWFSWTKFYQQDENAPNAIISYYTKGSLLALGLDLLIRQQSGYQKSLDDVLLHLWEHYGKPEIGLKEYQIEAICEQVAGCSLEAFFNRYLYGTEDLPLADWLKAEQVTFSLRGMSGLQDTGGESKNEVLKGFLGANFADTEHQSVKITHVWSDQPAYHAGLAAGDEIVALNGLKVANCAALEQRLKRVSMQENTVWECHYFRRDELRVTQLTPQSPVKDRVQLSLVSKKELALSPWLATMHNHQQG